MELFKLFGTIAVNNAQANTAIDQTSGKASSFSEKLKGGIKTVGKWGTAIVGGATAAGAALVGFASKSASAADRVDKMSQKIGISRQAFQELDFICSQSGTSVDTLQMGMKSLTTAMTGAANGTKSNVDQFNKLGVSVTNADGSLRSQEDVMWDVLSALQSMENQTEKARLATQLFGRSGTELMPLLNGASGSIDEMKQQAHDLGLVLSDELIDNGVNLTDSLDQTKRAFSSIAVQLGSALMPIVEKASDYIQQALPYIQQLFEKLEPVITNMLNGLLPPLMNLAESIFPILFDIIQQLLPPLIQIVQAVLPVIVQILETLLPPLIQIIQMVLPLLVNLITALLPILQPILALLQPLIDLLLAVLDPLINLLNMILPPLITILTKVINVIVSKLTPVIKALATILGTVLGAAFKAIGTVVKTVVDTVKSLWDGLKTTLTTVWNGIKTVAETVWNGIKSFLSGLMNGIKTVIETVWNGIKTTISTVVNGIKSTVSTVFGSIKTAISNIWEGIKTVVSNAINAVKTTISTVLGAAKTTVSTILDGIKSKFDIFNTIKTIVTSAINGVKTGISTGLNSAKTTVTSILDGIKTKFTNIFENVKTVVKNAIDKIKGFFKFSVSLPKIKLPHFAITPSGWKLSDLLEGTIPKLGIEWYAKAMDNPMIMTKPTAFGMNANGQVMAGGEKGSEVVSGTDTLMNMISEAVSVQNEKMYLLVEKLFAFLQQYIPELTNMQLVMDSGAVVGELASEMDVALGRLAVSSGRGVR